MLHIAMHSETGKKFGKKLDRAFDNAQDKITKFEKKVYMEVKNIRKKP